MQHETRNKLRNCGYKVLSMIGDTWGQEVCAGCSRHPLPEKPRAEIVKDGTDSVNFGWKSL